MPKLKYIGKASVPGVPARDLSESEVSLIGGGGLEMLLATGLYEEQKPPKPRQEAKLDRAAERENKMVIRLGENKSAPDEEKEEEKE